MGASLLTMGATGLGAGAVGNTANQVIRNSGFNNFSAKELAVSTVATGVALPAGKAVSGLASKAAEKFVSQVLQKTAQGGIIGGTAGSAGGFAGNVTDQTWDIASGTKDTFDTGSLIRDTGLGAITGFGIGTGIGYLGVKLPTSKTNVNKPTNQVTKSVQGNLNNEIGLINSPANRVGNNALKFLPAPPERLMLPAPKERLMLPAAGESSFNVGERLVARNVYENYIKGQESFRLGAPNANSFFFNKSGANLETRSYDAAVTAGFTPKDITDLVSNGGNELVRIKFNMSKMDNVVVPGISKVPGGIGEIGKNGLLPGQNDLFTGKGWTQNYLGQQGFDEYIGSNVRFGPEDIVDVKYLGRIKK